MKPPKILLVDDNDELRYVTKELLEKQNFEVVPAANVNDALNLIVSQPFDVLVTDLHMPNPGDGFAVVTAMRHSQPDALTLVVSGFPDVQGAMAAILLQADEILVKPFDVRQLGELLHRRTRDRKVSTRERKETISSILERESAITIQRWLHRVEATAELFAIPLTDSDRTVHLSGILTSIIQRLRQTRVLEPVAIPSPKAVLHGQLRFQQGYTAPMLVQESRILQVCIFETLQRNMAYVDFSMVLPDIMILADEVDSQLAQSIDSFLQEERRATA